MTDARGRVSFTRPVKAEDLAICECGAAIFRTVETDVRGDEAERWWHVGSNETGCRSTPPVAKPRQYLLPRLVNIPSDKRLLGECSMETGCGVNRPGDDA